MIIRSSQTDTFFLILYTLTHTPSYFTRFQVSSKGGEAFVVLLSWLYIKHHLSNALEFGLSLVCLPVFLRKLAFPLSILSLSSRFGQRVSMKLTYLFVLLPHVLQSHVFKEFLNRMCAVLS